MNLIEKNIFSYLNNLIGDSDSAVVHFGCGNSNSSIIQNLTVNHNITKYIGIDVNYDTIDKTKTKLSEFKQYHLIQQDMQTIIEECIEKEIFYDWSIIDGIFDKNIYASEQPNFVDMSIRNCLAITNKGLIIVFDTKDTKDSIFYSIEFIIALIQSSYNSFTITRLNESIYIITINKYY